MKNHPKMKSYQDSIKILEEYFYMEKNKKLFTVSGMGKEKLYFTFFSF